MCQYVDFFQKIYISNAIQCADTKCSTDTYKYIHATHIHIYTITIIIKSFQQYSKQSENYQFWQTAERQHHACNKHIMTADDQGLIWLDRQFDTSTASLNDGLYQKLQHLQTRPVSRKTLVWIPDLWNRTQCTDLKENSCTSKLEHLMKADYEHTEICLQTTTWIVFWHACCYTIHNNSLVCRWQIKRNNRTFSYVARSHTTIIAWKWERAQ
jgi:hypothetical protein